MCKPVPAHAKKSKRKTEKRRRMNQRTIIKSKETKPNKPRACVSVRVREFFSSFFLVLKRKASVFYHRDIYYITLPFTLGPVTINN